MFSINEPFLDFISKASLPHPRFKEKYSHIHFFFFFDLKILCENLRAFRLPPLLPGVKISDKKKSFSSLL